MKNKQNEYLPPGWVKAPFSRVVQPRGEKVSPSDYPSLPFIGMDHVEAHTTRILGAVPASDMKSNAARFYGGDILYGRLRPYLNKVTQMQFEGIASAEFIIFPDTELLRSAFLKYRLNAADFVSFASHLNEGDRPRVNFAQIGDFKILVPPTNEQVRIVSKLEELFSELDKGIESLKTAREQLTVYRQAVLKHAFEGKLTEEWRKRHAGELEPAETLLGKIKAERAQRYRQQLDDWKRAVKAWEDSDKEGKKPPKPSKPKELPSVDEEELSVLPNLPNSWTYLRLAEIAKIGSGMSVNKNRKLEEAVDIAYLRVANVQRGRLELDEIKTMSVEKDSIKELSLEKWDVLFTEGGDRDKLGRGWVWESQIKPCITQNHVFRATTYLRGEAHAKFVSHWGNTFGRDYFEREGKQTTNLASINKTVLSMFPVPLPPIEEQIEIINEIENASTLMSAFENEIEDSLSKAEALRQSLLKKAFEGRLVPQDPNDEPANALLERIKTEKAKLKKKSRKQKKVAV